MKIFLYVNSYLPLIGGREVVVHQLAMAYQELGHEVRVIGPGCWWKHRKTKFNYPLHRWPRLPFISQECSWTIQLFLAYIFYRPDIIHAHSTYPTAYIVARLKKYLNIPLIVTPHGEDIHVIPELDFGQRLDPVQDKKICYALEIAEYTTAISDSVATSISNAKVPDDKIILIPNGVDLNRFQKKQNFDVYDYLEFPSDSKIILTTGNYHPRKGHEVLIESIKQVILKEPKARLVIVGRTSDKLADKVHKDNLSEFVKFTGPLDVPLHGEDAEDILAALLGEARIYVSSSIDEGAEGMSLALLEAMSAGTCVIVTDISGNRDIITNGLNGMLVPPSSPIELAKSIIDVLNNNILHSQLREKSIETANKYSWLEIAKRYLSLYKTTIAKTRKIESL